MKRFIALIACTLFLTACSKGIDANLTTGEGAEAYRASLAKLEENMTPEDLKAFNWAVENMTIESLHQMYPNATPREIIRKTAAYYIEEGNKRLTDLEQSKPRYDQQLEQLKLINTENVRFTMDRNFHGLQPTVSATIINDSDLPVSKMALFAQLYIDNKVEPVATYEITANFNNASFGRGLFDTNKPISAGGLAPHTRINKDFHIGFVTGDISWTTLEIQKASQYRVTLTPMYYSVEDYANVRYMQGAPYSEIEQITTLLQQADQYKEY